MTSNQLDPKTKAEAYKETLRNALKADLYLLCHYLGYDQVTWSTHGEIITCLESDSKRKILVVPRDCFKSTIGIVCYSIWCLIRDPNDTILIDSELFTNSSTFLREIKGHLESDKLTSLFGKFKSSTWNDSEIIIKQRTKYAKEASITCGGVGTVKVGQHYKRILGDDYNSQNNSNTKEKCEKIINHFRYNLSILSTQGTYVLIGTRYSENDLIGWVLRELVKDKDLSEGKI